MSAREIGVVMLSMGLAASGSEWLVRRIASPPRYLLLAQMEAANSRPSDKPETESRANATAQSRGGAEGWLYVTTPSGRRLRPNASGVIKKHYLNGRDISIGTNSFGMRGSAVDWARRPRILFLGDSITLGDYLDESETFVRRVRDLSETTRAPWETLNAGVGSIGTGTERAILQEMLPLVKPDTVLLNVYLNDVVSSPAITLRPLPSALKHSWLAQYAYQALSLSQYLTGEKDESVSTGGDWQRWKREVSARYVAGPGDYRHSRPAFHALIQGSFRDWGSAWSEGAIDRILIEVSRMKDLAASSNARLAVAIHPVSYQTETEFLIDEPQQRLMDGFKRLQIPALDLLTELRAAARTNPRERLFYDQCHHTPEGSRIVSRALFEFLGAVENRDPKLLPSRRQARSR